MDTGSSSVTVIKDLFSDRVHQEIVDFLSNEVFLYTLHEDNLLFNRKHYQNMDYFVHIHNQLVEVANECFQLKLKPSYSFVSMYEDKGHCPLHLDRPPCYRTIDYLVSCENPDGWPIDIAEAWSDEKVASFLGKKALIDKEEKETRIQQEFWESVNVEENDAVAYSGTNSWHYRPTLSKGKANLVFFHFVKEDYDGPLL